MDSAHAAVEGNSVSRRNSFLHRKSIVVALASSAALVTLILAGCVPEPASDPTEAPVVDPTPTATPTTEPEPASGLPDLEGSDVVTVDAAVTADSGDRLRVRLTVYVPFDATTEEAARVAAELAAAGDESGVAAIATDRAGVLQVIGLEVTAIEGSWPAGVQVPLMLGVGAQDTVVRVPAVATPGTPDLAITGLGSGYAVAALTGAGPVSSFDWATLPLQYGILEGAGFQIDLCEVGFGSRAGDFEPVGDWVQGTCVVGVPG